MLPSLPLPRLRLLVAGLVAALLLPACGSKDPYQDPNYALKRRLRDRNATYDNYMERMRMRREAGDERYQAWFNSVME